MIHAQSSVRSCGLCAAVTLFWTAGVLAQAPMIVGADHPADFASPRGYAGVNGVGSEVVWQHVLHHPDATYLALHFEEFDLAPGDFLIVSDLAGGQEYTLDGRGKMNAGTFWAQHVKGDTLLLQLVATGPEGGRGFVIDKYAAGFVDIGGDRAICGTDDKENAICYQTSHPVEYSHARAVARLLSNGSAFCTGWLASSQDHLITNEHCISSASAALNTDYEFMAEAPTCGSANCSECWPGTLFSGATFIQDDAALDYCLVQINSGNPASIYGYLQIDNRVAVPGEEIYIPQHPGGRAKELAIFSTHSSDTGGITRVNSITAPPCSGSGFNDVGYYADTEGGSSGSPVLARSSHKVIALHHCANCPNRGVPIHLIYPAIAQYLTPGPAGQVALAEDAYACDGVLTVELRDGDLLGAGSQLVTFTAGGGDTENINLTETGAATGVFTGNLTLAAGGAVVGDGVLQVVNGAMVVVSYNDADTGSGSPAVKQDTAMIDCVAPIITAVGAAATGPTATVAFQTDEAACGRVVYGLSCAALNNSVDGACNATSHEILFSGLDPLTTYHYAVEAIDAVGNVAADDNNGACRSFDTPDFTFYFIDDFPTTTIDTTNWPTVTGAPTIDGVALNEPSAPNALRLNGSPSGDDAVESRTINLAGKTGLQLAYWFEQTGGGEPPDSGDDLFVEYRNTSGQWTPLAVHLGNEPDMTTFAQNVVNLPLAAYHAGFRFRIRVTATDGAFDDWFIDDVVLQPMPQAPPTAVGINGLETDMNVPFDIMLTGSDPNGDDLEYVITSLPGRGELSDPQGGPITATPYALANHGATVTYTPSPDNVGADGFTFHVNDGAFDSNTADVNLFVFAPLPVITTASLPGGVVGTPYGPIQFEATGGQPAVSWTLVTDRVYAEHDLGTSGFAEVGVAQGWHSDDNSWIYHPPFPFPFYGANQNLLRIWSNGFIDFGSSTGNTYANSTQSLIDNRRIAPLWDDLVTTEPGQDIFIDESLPDSVTIRWQAGTRPTLLNPSTPVDFSVTLHADGTIDFHYGPGNSPVTPTVGISNGSAVEYTTSIHNDANNLTYANSVRFVELTNMPVGLSFDDAGVLGGTPGEAGVFNPTFRITDSLDRLDQVSLTLNIAEAEVPDFDVDDDGDVDLRDYAGLQRCYTGDAVGPVAAGCGMFDSDVDADIDLVDLAAFIDALDPVD